MLNKQSEPSTTKRGENLREEYRLRFSKTELYRDRVWRVLCDDYFSKFIRPEASVLDLGSGWGEFINNIRAAKKWAMDLNPDAEQRLSADTQFLHQDCSLTWGIDSNSLDVVFTSNFLEHLPDKAHVEHCVSEAHRCLKDGGMLICLGPNMKYLHGSYWDFWDHFVPITDRSLVELFAMRNFDIHLQVPRFLPYSMSTGITPPLLALRTYLRLPMLWPFFGKQFLVVGRKRPEPRR